MNNCCGIGSKVLIYSCSGSSDVGEITDKVARKLSKEKIGQMTCLAGIGAGLSGFIESAKSADFNITIDGCKTQCSKKSLDKINVEAKSFVLTELGLEKNKTPVNEKVIEIIFKKIKKEVDKISDEKSNNNNCCCG